MNVYQILEQTKEYFIFLENNKDKNIELTTIELFPSASINFICKKKNSDLKDMLNARTIKRKEKLYIYLEQYDISSFIDIVKNFECELNRYIDDFENEITCVINEIEKLDSNIKSNQLNLLLNEIKSGKLIISKNMLEGNNDYIFIVSRLEAKEKAILKKFQDDADKLISKYKNIFKQYY